MPERKWYKDRPIRRTKALSGGRIRIIFDDAPPGHPGDTTTVTEVDYKGDGPDGKPNVRREFIDKTNKAAQEPVTEDISEDAVIPEKVATPVAAAVA